MSAIASPRARRGRGFSLESDVGRVFGGLHAENEGKRWPSKQWATDPIGFTREVLHVEALDEQAKILEAVRDYDRVAISSGQKIGKSAAAIFLGVWWYCTRRNARVILTARTDYQVNRVLFRELVRVVRDYERRHGKHTLGLLGETARTGLTAQDLREIRGSTVREVEAVSGISGGDLYNPEDPPAIMYLCDEASALPRLIYEAMDGNLAAGGKLVMFSQPTRNDGPFFEAFHAKRDYFFTWTIDAEKVAKRLAKAKRRVNGIADLDQIRRWKEEYGEDSAFYQIRVRGRFVLGEEGKIISALLIVQAQDRYTVLVEDNDGAELKLSAKHGRLHIGMDPAGAGGHGDESSWVLRRGHVALPPVVRRGLSEESHLAMLRELIRENCDPRELPPIVKIDSGGDVGAKVAAMLGAHLAMGDPNDRPEFILVRIRSSEPALREPLVYGTIRDELWASARQWIREGGAIPPDSKLAQELHAPDWRGDIKGRLKATPKEELRKVENLGRSPDRADGLSLAVWETPGLEVEQGDKPLPPAPARPQAPEEERPHPPDPYAIADQSYRR